MQPENTSNERSRFLLTIVLPTAAALVLALAAVYFFILPTFTSSYLSGKKQSIRELTRAAWHLLEHYHQLELSGKLTRIEAQSQALHALESVRYGENQRDYFWVTDNKPRLLMHPYSKELLGQDLTDFTGPDGKRLFVEIRKTVAKKGKGFIDYSWNKKYSQKIATPKLSFVEHFPPWDWVVGTGVFLDDVEIKVNELTGKLSRLSLLGVGLLFCLLFYLGRKSYIAEKVKSQTLVELRKSRTKYKALVEKSSEATLLYLGERCVFFNQAAIQAIGCDEKKMDSIRVGDIFLTRDGNQLQLKKCTFENDECAIEVVLQRSDGVLKEVMLTVTLAVLEDQHINILKFSDISLVKKVERELGDSKAKYSQLTSQLDIGVFRADCDKEVTVREANRTFYEIVKLDSESSISLISLLGQFDTREDFFDQLQKQGGAMSVTVHNHNNGGEVALQYSLFFAHDDKNNPLYCDGLVKDISREIQIERELEERLVDLKSHDQLLLGRIDTIASPYERCTESDQVSDVLSLIIRKNVEQVIVFIDNEPDSYRGVVKPVDILSSLLQGSITLQSTIGKVPCSSLWTVSEDTPIFEASLLLEEGHNALGVTGDNGHLTSLLRHKDLVLTFRDSASYIVQKITRAEDISEVKKGMQRLPQVIALLVSSGSTVSNLTRLTRRVSHAVVTTCIDLAIDELGEPPVGFAFLGLGSEGRGEQTLATDQDNAIIYEDISVDESVEVAEYFSQLGTMVCTWLDDVGYDFCKGGIMAMNSDWCQPLSVWKEYFSKWIAEAKPKDLLDVCIFFDFHCIYGADTLADQLRRHITQTVSHRDAFFYQLAQNTLLFKLPVDFFGNIAVDSSGEHPGTFNIKHVIAIITGYARIYAINFGFEETNSLKRLELLRERNFIPSDSFENMKEAYTYLMQFRFKHQIRCLHHKLIIDNFIDPEELTDLEKTVFKKILSQVGEVQNKLSAIGKVEIFF